MVDTDAVTDKTRKSPKRTAADFIGEWVGEAWICQRYGITRVTRWRWTKEGKFPAPVELAPGVTRWAKSTILAWEAQKAGASVTAA